MKTSEAAKWLARKRVWVASLLLVICAGRPAPAAAPPAMTLLPQETAIVVSAADSPDLFARFMNTAFGRMSLDPQIQPLVKEVYESLAGFVEGVGDPLGLSLSELAGIPQGEVTIAVVAPDQAPLCFVLMIDTGSHVADGRRLLNRVTAALARSGAQESEETVSGTKLVVYDSVGRHRRRLVFLEKSNAIVVGSNLDVLKQMLAVWNGEHAPILADDSTFNAVMSHCGGSAGEKPQAVWYVNPSLLAKRSRRGPSTGAMATALAPKLGLDGLLALGGSLALDVGPLDLVTDAHALLDSPRAGIFEVLALGSGDMEPERWVPADVASYTTVHWQLEAAYKSAARLYDGLNGEGEWAKLVESEVGKIAPVSFEQEVLPALEGRITYAVWIERPVTAASQASLVAFRLKEGAALDAVLRKVAAQNAPYLKPRSVAGAEYFEYTPPPSPGQPGAADSLSLCFGLLDGYLLATDRSSLYEEAVRTSANPSKSLSQSPDFELIARQIRQRSAIAPAMIRFERPEEELRVSYGETSAEGARDQRRARGRSNPFFLWLDAALKAHPLPHYSVIERYLAPKGAVVTDGASGIHYTGFTLRRAPD